jgi:hypothetical protein
LFKAAKFHDEAAGISMIRAGAWLVRRSRAIVRMAGSTWRKNFLQAGQR